MAPAVVNWPCVPNKMSDLLGFTSITLVSFVFLFIAIRWPHLSNIIFNRTPFAGGALGFNLAEINSLITQNVFSDFKNVNNLKFKNR